MAGKVPVFFLLAVLFGAGNLSESFKIPVIFNTDANNEVDDQHALAYLLFSATILKWRVLR